MAGLNPNIRLVPEPQEEMNLDDIVVIDADEGGPNAELDESGNVVRIEHANGDVTVSIDGGPISRADEDSEPEGWYDNLADDIDENELSRISEELLRGIDADIQTRSDWIEDRAQGLKLLGLKIEIPGVQGTSDGAPVEGMSKVRHPLLLEAVLRFQANARSELLPTDGPVKIRDDSNNSGVELDTLANALERDMNHYLTVTASEYYPDTDRMLFMVGFGGDGFKKVYFCPLRNRPVSESIDAEDLIVNNAATDLESAKRITHRIMMRPSVVKRMQIIGAYRDIPLYEAAEPKLNAAKEEKNAQQGVSNTVMNHEDRDREIYECYCELDIKGFEHMWKGAPSGLEVPYRVTIDVSSRQILSVVRNYKEEDEELPTARKVFVKYPFVPGLGFYDIGLLHILGNTTNAVTAAWRELLDAGMFAAFPGFLMADQGARQNTNIFRVPPGGSATVKTNGMRITDAIMPLPYKEPSGALMTLSENISQYGQRLGGTAELAVGEGRQDAPVGTTLAMIDQATKVLNSVHKRLHAAQAEEFQLLKDCFRENPESFWQRNNSPAYPWDQDTFLQALDNHYLVPQADPNTASQTQRMMKTMALIQLASQAPDMYDLQAVNRQALRTIGYNPEEFVKKDTGDVSPDTMRAVVEMQSAQAKIQNETMTAQADAALKAAQAQKTMAEIGGPTGEGQNPADMMNAQAALMGAENDRIDLGLKQKQLEVDNKDITIDGQNRAAERDSREKLAMVNLQRDALKMDHEKAMQQSDMEKIAMQNALKPEKPPVATVPGKKPKPGLLG